MEELITEIKALFYDDHVIDAFRKIKANEDNPEIAQALEQVPEVHLIRSEVSVIEKMLQELGDMGSWTQVYADAEIGTFYKPCPGGFFVRAELLLNSSLFPVLALFSEVDLFHNWITQLNRFTLVGEPTRFMKLLHYTLDLPWPLSNRDISLACHGVAVPENKSALIVLRDMPESYLSYTSPPVDPNNVRISIPVGGLNVMFRGPNQTQVSLILNANPHIQLIPNWLLTQVVKHLLYYFMDSIRTEISKFEGSEYERRVQERAEYYEEIRARISKYIDDNN